MGVYILVIFLIVLLITILYLLLGLYFYNLALNPKINKEFVIGEFINRTEEEKEFDKKELEWLKSNSTNVYITSTNNGNLKLHAYQLNNHLNSNKWVIAIHGYMGQGSDITWITKEFNARGYNVLALDLRGHRFITRKLCWNGMAR